MITEHEPISEHQVEGDAVNSQLKLEAIDARSEANAHHVYAVTLPGDSDLRDRIAFLKFQKGPIKEVGVNGITNEVLLAIVLDRLRGFQNSKFACDENAHAIAGIESALDALKGRTKARLARGVEGTHEV